MAKNSILEKKLTQINKTLEYLNKIIIKAFKKKDYELFIQAASYYSNIKYTVNQDYVDLELEELIEKLSQNININKIENTNKNVVLFYDGFGLDTRGLAFIYLKALCQLNYDLIYVTIEQGKNNQPEIDKILDKSNAKKIYLPKVKNYKYCKELIRIIENEKPSNAFFYSLPNDIAGIIAFSLFENVINRFQINLTDHAFWCGRNIADFSIEFRDYGASISNHYRNIESEKIIKLPFYPCINYEKKFEGFPFKKEDYQKVIFSGGSLYKTLGEGNKFYTIVEQLLKKNNNLIFLYAGFGDTSEINKLQSKYPSRVYHIQERKDLFQLMQHIDIYLNTYPMVGGLMMQYAALAGKPPFTLKHDEDGEGILINQKELEIEFDDENELIDFIDEAIKKPEKIESMEQDVKKSVISEIEFKNELQNIIQNHKSQYAIDFTKIDTSAFLRNYLEKISLSDIKNIFSLRDIRLIRYFPFTTILKTMKKLIYKLK